MFWNWTFWNQTFWNLTFWNPTLCGCTLPIFFNIAYLFRGQKRKYVFSKMSVKLKNKRTSDHHSPVAKFLVPDGGYSGQSFAIVDYIPQSVTTNLASGAPTLVTLPKHLYSQCSLPMKPWYSTDLIFITDDWRYRPKRKCWTVWVLIYRSVESNFSTHNTTGRRKYCSYWLVFVHSPSC